MVCACSLKKVQSQVLFSRSYSTTPACVTDDTFEIHDKPKNLCPTLLLGVWLLP